jgi:hypothetical protein
MNTAVAERAVACSAAPRTVLINPLQYPSWDAEISRLHGSSFFHCSSWARVLKETYGHIPVYFCAVRNDRIEQALPIMEVSSTWTGRRGVSLPFSDFCPALKNPGDDASHLYEAALEHGRQRNWKCLECRDRSPDWPEPSGAKRTQVERSNPPKHLQFFTHVVELEPNEEALFKRLDSSMRRGVRKAQKEGLTVKFNDDFPAIRTFYRLHCQTRKRHGMPPQPLKFFDRLQKYCLQTGAGVVGIARFRDRPIAASVFLEHKDKALYKFGASDFAFQHLRPSNVLMWEAMKKFAARGFSSLHFGRTSLSNEGLRRFKLGFGSREKLIEHRKFDFIKEEFVSNGDQTGTTLKRLFRLLPMPFFRLVGTMLYPHLS